MSEKVQDKTAFITGGSRGIGAEVARSLARKGFDIAIGYQDRKKVRRFVNPVLADIEAIGTRAIAVKGDITTEEGRAEINSTLQEEKWLTLIALVLNAAGGLEKDKVDADPNYAMTVNRDAQLALLTDQMPRLTEGSSVVYVTSHWSHMYGAGVELPPFDYAPVASTKYAGEQALLGRRGELATIGSRLLIATAGVVTGTFVGDQGIKKYDDWAHNQGLIKNIVPAELVGESIADAIVDPSLESGHTLWIGADEEQFMRACRLREGL